MVEQKQTKAWGIASLICGILSILLILMPYFGLPLAITAIVFYCLQKKHCSNGFAVGGLVTGIIGVVLNTVIILFIGMVFLAAYGMA